MALCGAHGSTVAGRGRQLGHADGLFASVAQLSVQFEEATQADERGPVEMSPAE